VLTLIFGLSLLLSKIWIFDILNYLLNQANILWPIISVHKLSWLSQLDTMHWLQRHTSCWARRRPRVQRGTRALGLESSGGTQCLARDWSMKGIWKRKYNMDLYIIISDSRRLHVKGNNRNHSTGSVYMIPWAKMQVTLAGDDSTIRPDSWRGGTQVRHVLVGIFI